MNAQGSMALAGGRLTIPAGDGLLRLALKLDALVTGLNGAAYVAAAGVLDSLLGVPASTQRPIGAFLLAFAGLVWFVASRPAIGRGVSAAVIGANLLWVAGSIVALVAGWHSPTLGGSVWMALQALVVALFAALQLEGRALARR